jgi:hypothetical protein
MQIINGATAVKMQAIKPLGSCPCSTLDLTSISISTLRRFCLPNQSDFFKPRRADLLVFRINNLLPALLRIRTHTANATGAVYTRTSRGTTTAI